MSDDHDTQSCNFELKKIDKSGVKRALEKAKHYRDLNDPSPAESICLDVLEVAPKNQEALVLLILARIDQIPTGQITMKSVLKRLAEVKDKHAQMYYTGILYERRGYSLLTGGMSSSFAFDAFREAMRWYERAEEVRPEGNYDARHRWNNCVRLIDKRGLCPRHDSDEPAPLGEGEVPV